MATALNTANFLALPAIFSDGMVLQADAENTVWGKAAAGAEVTARLRGEECRTQADGAGRWELRLAARDAGGPFTLEITAAQNGEISRRTINDVYTGEVWLCSGQSNMELPMARLKDTFPGEFIPPVNALVRQFRVPQAYCFAGETEELAALGFDGIPAGGWLRASSKTLYEFSGTAWFFAQRRFQKHPIAIGLIHAAIGGTPVESWMSREALRAFPRLYALAETYADDAVRAAAVKANDDYMAGWEAANAAADSGRTQNGAAGWERDDGAGWPEIMLPGEFAAVPELKHFCGTLWLTQSFTVETGFAGQAASLHLGTIIDADTAYINGIKVGETTYRYPPRKYAVPEGILRAGANRITLRVVCNNGIGEVTPDKPFKLFFEPRDSAPVVNFAGTWRYKIGGHAPERAGGFFIHWQPAGLYNAMIAPLLRYRVKGVIWHQGESNEKAPDEYEALFKTMITEWRARRGQPALPFLFVQLPLYGNPEAFNEQSPWARIRAAQQAALELPYTGMAAALDLGEWNDLHPLNKKAVGYRLAYAAEAVVDGELNTAPGPVPQSVSCQNETLTIRFAHAGEGLRAPGSVILTLVDEEGHASQCHAVITAPDTLNAAVPSGTTLCAVYYAWANNPTGCNLYNSDGLPAPPFRVRL